METSARSRHLPSSQDDMSKKLRLAALAIPAMSLLGGVVMMTIGPQFGLFAAAIILGWTQLVGL
jgi:hypothetical protein